MVRWPLVGGKITQIYNGIASIDFLDKEAARKFLLSKMSVEASVKDNHTWIGTISELHRNKGLDYLIEAIAKLSVNHSPLVLIVIGEGQERADLERLIAAKELGGNVFLLGAVPDAKRYLKAFDIFTLTSRKEGLPYAILEAGSASLPVLASQVGGIPEMITDRGSGLLVSPANPSEIADKLSWLLEHSTERTRLGEKLAEHVRDQFATEKMVKQTIALYNSTA